MSISITKCTSTVNTTACAKRTPKYLVIHYTAGTNSSTGHAKSIAQYFAKASTKASADFIVDDGTIVQFNPDPTTRYCWSVGGSKYKTMSTSIGGRLYGIAKNSNCINIEMCSSKKSTKTLNATDTDWYFTDATINNGLKCAKYLMDLYKIPIENVIIHHEITGKICCNPFCVNEAALKKWYAFKARLSDTTTSTVTSTTQTQTTTIGAVGTTAQCPFVVKCLDDLNIRKTPGGEVVKVNGCAKGTKYTITQVSGNWGKLKSGAGWISISNKYVIKC